MGEDEERLERLAARRGLDTTVYEPAEDSALLANACIGELSGEDLVIEAGSGSGYVAVRIREAVGARVLGVDVNPIACRRTKKEGIPAIRGDLLTAIRPNVADAVVCNPPYLPTEPEAEHDDWLSVAVSGGESGRAVIERLLADADRVLRPNGRLFLLVSSLTDIDAVTDHSRSVGFVGTEIARDDSFPFEVLVVLRFERE